MKKTIITVILSITSIGCDPNLPGETENASDGGSTGRPDTSTATSTTTTTSTTTSTTTTTTQPDPDSSSGEIPLCNNKPYGGSEEVECCEHHVFSFAYPQQNGVALDTIFPHENSPLDSDFNTTTTPLQCTGNSGIVDLSKYESQLNIGWSVIGGMFFDWPSPQSSQELAQYAFDNYACIPIQTDQTEFEWELISEIALATINKNCRANLEAQGCKPGSSSVSGEFWSHDICYQYMIYPLRQLFKTRTYELIYLGNVEDWEFTQNTICDFASLNETCDGGADGESSG